MASPRWHTPYSPPPMRSEPPVDLIDEHSGCALVYSIVAFVFVVLVLILMFGHPL